MSTPPNRSIAKAMHRRAASSSTTCASKPAAVHSTCAAVGCVLVPRGQDDVGPALGQRPSAGQTDASRGPGDDRDAALESAAHRATSAAVEDEVAPFDEATLKRRISWRKTVL